MRNWKSTTKRKKVQRHINRVIRDMNRTIERDPLWLGRFYCYQTDIAFSAAEDGTYLYAVVGVEFVDRKSGKAMHHLFRKEDFMGTAWKFWTKMNYFITEWCDVWSEDPRPSIRNPWDYRKDKR